jgi:hypothetical protein
VIDCLPSKHKALSSNSSMAKKKKKKEKEDKNQACISPEVG